MFILMDSFLKIKQLHSYSLCFSYFMPIHLLFFFQPQPKVHFCLFLAIQILFIFQDLIQTLSSSQCCFANSGQSTIIPPLSNSHIQQIFIEYLLCIRVLGMQGINKRNVAPALKELTMS